MRKHRSGRSRRSAAEWAGILRQLKESGSTQAEFCRSRGVALTSLQKWARRLKASTSSEFVELTPRVEFTEESAWQIEVQLPAGISIRLRR